MSSTGSNALFPLISAFRDRAHRLDLVPALHYLSACFPNAASPGGRGPYQQEALRFAQSHQLCFATKEIQSVALDGNSRVQLRSTLLAFCSAESPLPDSMLHELARQGERERRSRDYLDLFYHRLFGFFYRGRKDQDLAGQCVLNAGRDDPVSLLRTAGLLLHPEEHRSLGPRQELAVAALLTGHASTSARLASACRAIISSTLPPKSLGELQVTVQEFQGGRCSIAPKDWSRLGSCRVRLGQSTHLGQHCYQPASAVCIELAGLGPSSLSAFELGSELHARLSTLIHRCTPPKLELKLVLRLACAPDLRAALGRRRLGRDSWLTGSGPATPRLRTIPLDLCPRC